VDQGADSFEGHFTSADGTVLIRHDIGGYAGAWAKTRSSALRKETVVENSRVWIAQRPWPDVKGRGGQTTLMAVTFPDAGCANFFLTSSDPKSFAWIEYIAATFRPKAPVTRSDYCR